MKYDKITLPYGFPRTPEPGQGGGTYTAGDGIKIDELNAIGVDYGPGLDMTTTDKLTIDYGPGLDMTTTDKLTIDYGPGLDMTTTDKLTIKAGNGLELSGSDLATKIGNGLEFSSGAMQAKLGTGLSFGTGGVINSHNEPTLVTTGLTPAANVTIKKGGYCKVGNMIIVSMQMDVTDGGAFTNLISGMPVVSIDVNTQWRFLVYDTAGTSYAFVVTAGQGGYQVLQSSTAITGTKHICVETIYPSRY